jgi:hypothetical protein
MERAIISALAALGESTLGGFTPTMRSYLNLGGLTKPDPVSYKSLSCGPPIRMSKATRSDGRGNQGNTICDQVETPGSSLAVSQPER